MVEVPSRGDNFWCGGNKGANTLGTLLTKVRETLRQTEDEIDEQYQASDDDGDDDDTNDDADGGHGATDNDHGNDDSHGDGERKHGTTSATTSTEQDIDSAPKRSNKRRTLAQRVTRERQNVKQTRIANTPSFVL